MARIDACNEEKAMPATADTVRHAQQAFLHIADEMHQLDQRLDALIDLLDSGPRGLLSEELVGVARCLRTDVLVDAIDTLRVLGRQTEEDVAQKRIDVLEAVEALASHAF